MPEALPGRAVTATTGAPCALAARSASRTRARDSCSTRSTASATWAGGVSAVKGKSASGRASPRAGAAARNSSALKSFQPRQPNFWQKRITAEGLVKLARASSRAFMRATCPG